MPPEYFKDGIFGLKSDVWSYGVVVWEILTKGEKPYKVSTNNWKAPHKKQTSDTVCTIYTLKRQWHIPCFVCMLYCEKHPKPSTQKTKQMTYALFLCGRFRRALRNNACIKVR